MPDTGKTIKTAPAAPAAEPAVTRIPPIERFREALALEAGIEARGPEYAEEISTKVVTAILEAETLEDAIAAAEEGGDSGKDMVDVEMIVTDFAVVKSDGKFKTTVKHYLEVEATRLDTGEQIRFSVGAPNVVTLLWKARRTGRLPLECVIRSRDTANGELLTLKLLPPRAVRVDQ